MHALRHVARFTALALALIAAPAAAQWPTAPGTDLAVTGLAWFSSSRVVSDGAGGVIVAWTDIRVGGSPTAIYAQRYDADGFRLWASSGSMVVPVGGSIDEFRACSDDSNGIVVTWRTINGADANRVYAQRMDALGQRRWGASGVRVCTLETSQSFPRIAGDGLGGTIVTWFDNRAGFADSVHAQRLDLSGTRLWTGGGVGIGGTYFIRTSEIATRAGGGAYLAWWCTGQLVRCVAVDANGSALWPHAPIALQPPSTVPPPIQLVADGIGGAVVATEWSNQIFHRRLDSTGALGSPGALLNSGTWGQGDVRLASDGAGHVFASWLDGRVAFTGQMRTQRLRPDGTGSWLADGELVGPQVTISTGYHASVHDGAGGLLAAFSSAFGGRAERLSAGGAPLWTTHPVVFSTNNPRPPMTLVPTTGNGGILVWQADFDVRAKRILGNGAISTVDADRPAGPLATQFAPPTPNPSRADVSLRFTLAAPSDVRLTIHDAQGRLVRDVAHGAHGAGTHHLSWNGADASGTRVPPGLYFARFEAGGAVRRQRLVVLER